MSTFVVGAVGGIPGAQLLVSARMALRKGTPLARLGHRVRDQVAAIREGRLVVDAHGYLRAPKAKNAPAPAARTRARKKTTVIEETEVETDDDELEDEDETLDDDDPDGDGDGDEPAPSRKPIRASRAKPAKRKAVARDPWISSMRVAAASAIVANHQPTARLLMRPKVEAPEPEIEVRASVLKGSKR